MSVEERFALKVNKNGPLPAYRPELGPCWLWLESLAHNGYGDFYVNGKRQLAHRWSYEHHVAPIPAGYQVDHLCRVRGCVNPAHLEAVTQQENIRRQMAAITHCPKGHEYTPENTYRRKDGRGRQCKRCGNENNAALYDQYRREHIDPDRSCVVCTEPIPFSMRADAKYCGDECRRTANRKVEKQRRRIAA